MIENIAHKQVELCLSNGAMLEGFVNQINEGYAELIELDNSAVIVKIDDISFVRIGISEVVKDDSEEVEQPVKQPPQQPLPRPQIARTQHHDEENYSMSLPKLNEETYSAPSFVRTTPK